MHFRSLEVKRTPNTIKYCKGGLLRILCVGPPFADTAYVNSHAFPGLSISPNDLLEFGGICEFDVSVFGALRWVAASFACFGLVNCCDLSFYPASVLWSLRAPTVVLKNPSPT